MEIVYSFLDKTGFRLIGVVVTAVFGFLIVRNLIKQIKIAILASQLDNSLVNFVLTFFRFALLLALVLVCLAMLGIPLTGIVSAISAATLAIGLAIKDILSSVANGIMLVATGPFKENDYVDIGGVAGTIQEVTLMHTVMNTPDNKRIMMPNSQVYASAIINYSSNEFRRMDLNVEIDYEEDPEKARDVLLKVAESHPLVCREPAPICRYSYEKNTSISLNVKVWARTSDYWAVNWDLNEQLTGALVSKGFRIPLPQVSLRYRKPDEGKEAAR